MLKNWQVRATIWSWDVEKLHATVARSTFSSQNVQNTSCSDHFLKLGCGAIARCCGAKHIFKSKCTKHIMFGPFFGVGMWKNCTRCGAKHIFKSKCTKHIMFGPLFEVGMWRNCTQLWREAHFQVKMYKTHHVRTIFWSWDVEKLRAALARSTFSSQNVQSTSCSDHFLELGCGKIARRCGAKHVFKSKCTKHIMFGPFFEVGMWKNWMLLWREAHFQVKMYKTRHARTTFWSWDVEILHAAVARDCDSWTSPNNAPATESHIWTSPNNAPATESHTWTSPNIAPATKSDTWTSPNSAPATKSETWLCYSFTPYSLTLYTTLWLFYSLTLLSFYCTILWLYYSLALLFFDSTELLLDWTSTWLNCYSTELVLEGKPRVIIPSWFNRFGHRKIVFVRYVPRNPPHVKMFSMR